MVAGESPHEAYRQGAEARLAELLDMPLFSCLSPPSREALAFEIRLLHNPGLIPAGFLTRPSYVRFEEFNAGRILLNQGDLGTDLFIVLDGIVSAVRASADLCGTELLNTYKRGDWFGEASALFGIPSLSSARTQTPGEVAVIDARLFRKLYLDEREETGLFWKRVDEGYRERSLLMHLKVSPLFAKIDDKDLLEVKKEAEFLSFAGGKKIAAEGDQARAFYLVRSGAVKCYREVEGKERILAYYMGNSSFGEHAIATVDPAWPATFEAMTPTDVVQIPRTTFERLLAASPATHRRLTRRANQIVSGDGLDALYGKVSGDDPDGQLARDEIEVMVHGQSVKGGNALVIDKVKCIRCNVCVESCAAVHGDGINRLSKVGTSISTNAVLINACYNCAIPECMARCNYGAIRRDASGMVRFVYDNCVGCAECTYGCPYGVIRMAEPRLEDIGSLRPRPLQGLLASIPGLRSLFGLKKPEPRSELRVVSMGGEKVEVAGKAVKCDSCAGLPFEACVYNCPTGAIERRSPEDLFKL